jgi:hypothetical protein
MCRTGGRRCRGNDSAHKARLRQRISRTRKAITAAHAAGNITAAVLGELQLAAARGELAALNAVHNQQPACDNAADQGRATTEDTMGDKDKRDSTADGAGDVTGGGSYGGRVGNITGNGNVTIVDAAGPVHIGRGVQVNGGVINSINGIAANVVQGGDVTGGVRITNGRVQVGDPRTGGVVIGHAAGPVQAGDGIQINGGSWDSSHGGDGAEHEAALAAARAQRRAAKEARKQAKAERQQARQERPSRGASVVTISGNGGGVMMGDGYTVIGGAVYRHPGRSVSVHGTTVTDATTGQRLEPTRTVSDTGRGHSVVSSNGVLYVNGQRID